MENIDPHVFGTNPIKGIILILVTQVKIYLNKLILAEGIYVSAKLILSNLFSVPINVTLIWIFFLAVTSLPSSSSFSYFKKTGDQETYYYTLEIHFFLHLHLRHLPILPASEAGSQVGWLAGWQVQTCLRCLRKKNVEQTQRMTEITKEMDLHKFLTTAAMRKPFARILTEFTKQDPGKHLTKRTSQQTNIHTTLPASQPTEQTNKQTVG